MILEEPIMKVKVSFYSLSKEDTESNHCQAAQDKDKDFRSMANLEFEDSVILKLHFIDLISEAKVILEL
jgi:hypothetical protein